MAVKVKTVSFERTTVAHCLRGRSTVVQYGSYANINVTEKGQSEKTFRVFVDVKQNGGHGCGRDYTKGKLTAEKG